MIKLYQLATCPYCEMVRKKLNELSIEYEIVEVPMMPEDRKEVFELSAQYFVPVIQDGDKVIDDEVRILPYLEEKYGKQQRSNDETIQDKI